MLANVVGARLLSTRRRLPHDLRRTIRRWISNRLAIRHLRRAVVGTDHDALDHVPVLHDGRIGAGRELDGCRCHQRENDVRRLGPRKLLFLRHLHGEVHGLFCLFLPIGAGSLVNLVFTDDAVTHFIERFIVQIGRDIDRLDPA